MVRACILFILAIIVSCTGDGNIHLLEEDVAEALRACSQISNKGHRKINQSRQRRSDKNNYNDKIPRIDANTKEDVNPYSHSRRNTDTLYQMHTFNGSNYNNTGYEVGIKERKFNNSLPRQIIRNNNVTRNIHNYTQNQRVKRHELLIRTNDYDQCLSQCVFANLHMVDLKGIPREAELWNKVQISVTSQQSRVLIRDQIRACFQELQSESEDDGCSYSNKLERCLMLRFSDRTINNETSSNSSSRNHKQRL
ncbi:unnamed protein product [Euphydryas editha]|uniref:Uncharacterized protein n=1 Tax=Euphydryas editha TaxID=104508 RepID=A0AAU9TR29_EUPED|nr:unnamed protein product [Euphydryas editha]